MRRVSLLTLISGAALAIAMSIGPSTGFAATTLCEATQSTCEGGNVYGVGTEVKASLSGGEWVITPSGELPTISCEESEMKGEVKRTETPRIDLSSLSLSGCSQTTKVLDPGELIVHHSEGHDGEVTWRGWEIEVVALFEVLKCVYGGKVESGIALTGGSPASTDGTATISLVEEKGIFECPSSAVWHGNYEVTAPEPLYVSEE
jgi:hypothetical protein